MAPVARCPRTVLSASPPPPRARPRLASEGQNAYSAASGGAPPARWCGSGRLQKRSVEHCRHTARAQAARHGVDRQLTKPLASRRTMAKVCKSDGQGTFAGTQGNGEVAPIPDLLTSRPGTALRENRPFSVK